MTRLALAALPLLAALAIGTFLAWPSAHELSPPAPPPAAAATPTDAPDIEFKETFYNNQQLKSRSAMRGDLRHGESLGYYTNGQLQVRETYDHGVATGPRSTWYPDGTRKSAASLIAGEFHGLYRQWHLNGTLAYEVTYIDGKPDGRAVAYYPSGYLKTEVTMLAGVVSKQQQWPDGQRR